MKLIQVPVVIVPFNICRDSKIRCTLQDLRNQDTNWATFWFDLARFDDLTQIHEFVRLSSGLATWHPLLCPQAWGKGFYVFFYGSDFRALEALAHCHWDANELSDESDEGFVMSLNSAWTLPSPFLKRLRRHRKLVLKISKDIQCEISYIQIYSMNQMNQKTTTLNYCITQRQSHRYIVHVVWHLDRSTEVATHWELLVLLEGSGRLKMDENHDKSKKQNQSVDSKVSVYIMKIMNQQFESIWTYFSYPELPHHLRFVLRAAQPKCPEQLPGFTVFSASTRDISTDWLMIRMCLPRASEW